MIIIQNQLYQNNSDSRLHKLKWSYFVHNLSLHYLKVFIF